MVKTHYVAIDTFKPEQKVEANVVDEGDGLPF